MDRLALDTTVLIDLQNESRKRGAVRGATHFLMQHQDTELVLPVVALGEYLEGFRDPTSKAALALVSRMRVLAITSEIAREYAVVARRLRSNGLLIGANDLWIGCTAKVAGLPLVTRNGEHFRRIDGLAVVGYSA